MFPLCKVQKLSTIDWERRCFVRELDVYATHVDQEALLQAPGSTNLSPNLVTHSPSGVQLSERGHEDKVGTKNRQAKQTQLHPPLSPASAFWTWYGWTYATPTEQEYRASATFQDVESASRVEVVATGMSVGGDCIGHSGYDGREANRFRHLVADVETS